jgi:PTH2 family peptidyl-tRNA hydrolase
MGCKLVLVVRKDLSMGVGKIASQCSHASVMAYQKSNKIMLLKWTLSGHKKVVVECPDENALFEIKAKAKEHRIMTNVVRDAGLTQVGPNTATVLAVGPAKEEAINQVTGHLIN